MRSLSRRLLPALALTLLALAALTAVLSPSAAQAQQQPGAESQHPTLEATAGWTLTLTLTGHTSDNWWFRINWWGTCTAATAGTVDNIGGYTGGPHDVRAYSDSNCGTEIASTTFTVQEPTLTATVNADRSVDLTLENGPNNWWFRIGSGTCTAVTGPTFSNIRGYAAGTYYVGSGSDSACTQHISTTGFTIPEANLYPNASLSPTVNWDKSVDLALSNGPTNWWFRINWWGDCTAATGTSYNNIRGYAAGTHSVSAYSDNGCHTRIASSSFTIANTTLTATVNDDRSIDLTLAGGPNNWWFRLSWWGDCTAATGTSYSNIRGYAAGTYDTAAYADSGCNNLLAAATITVPTATLTTTVNSDKSVDLAVSNGPTNWWFRINWWGTCTPASGTTVSNIGGYAAGTHSVWAYSDSGCAWPFASAAFTIVAAKPSAPAAPTLTTGNGQLAVAWTAPSNNGSAITDYDMQYRAVGATDWNTAFIRHVSYTKSGVGNHNKQSNGSTGAAIDLGTVALTGLTVTKLSGNVYKITEAIGGLRVRLSGRNSQIGSTLTYRARYASTAPGNSMNTHGTLLWERTVGYGTNFTGEATTGALPANTHFWITTTASGKTDGVNPTIQADAAAGVPSTLTSTIAGLTNGTSYDVQVRATNTVGTGDWSPSATLKAGLPARVTAPTLVSGNQQLTVSWTAVSGNGSTPVYYDVQYSPDGGTTWNQKLPSQTTETTETITGLTNDTAYLVQVRATNSVGRGKWSPSSASVKAGAPAAPAAPTLTPAAGQVTVTWTAPDNSGSPITDYDLRHSSDSGATWTFVENGTSTSTTATITGLTDGTAYQVQVRAENVRGAGGWSPSTTLATLTAGNVADTTATLTFAGGSHTGNWYVKETSPATNATCSSVIASTTTTHDLSALTRNTAYTFQAYSDSGCTTAIAIVTFSTLPSSLTASSVSNETATLTISSDHSGDWYVKETSPSTTAACSTAISGTAHNLTGLTDGAPHVYRAYSDSGCTTAVAQGTFTTTLYAPTNVSHSAPNENCGGSTCNRTASWSRNSSTTGKVGYQVQSRLSVWDSWGDWHTVQPTTNASLSHSANTATGNFDVRVRAFRTTGSTTVYSAWVQ